jgi:hypothetical protein
VASSGRSVAAATVPLLLLGLVRPTAPAAAAQARPALLSISGTPPVVGYVLGAGLGAARSREAVFADGRHGLLVVGGRVGAPGSPAGSVELVDVASGKVTPAGAIGRSVADGAAVTLGTLDLVVGGSSGTGGSGLSAASLRVLPPGRAGHAGWAPAGKLPSPRAGAGAAEIRGRIYLAGGYTAGGDTASVLASRDGRHFSPVAQLALAVRYPAVVADGDALEVIGGETDFSGVPEPVADVQQLLPGERVARIIAHLPEPVSGAQAWVASGVLYVAGGDTGLSAAGAGLTDSGAVWSYLASRRVFELAGELSEPVSHAGVAVLGPDAYLVGGEFQGNPVATLQEVVRRR